MRFKDARNDPRPMGRLPLMIGGGGERRTLRIVARDADAWNGEGDVSTFTHKSRVLDEHCLSLARDPAAIRRTVGLPPPCIRDTREEAVAVLAATLERSGYPAPEALAVAGADAFADTDVVVSAQLAGYAAAGAAEVIFDWPALFDGETLQRLAAIRRTGLLAH